LEERLLLLLEICKQNIKKRAENNDNDNNNNNNTDNTDNNNNNNNNNEYDGTYDI
jgi:hypothetical protein